MQKRTSVDISVFIILLTFFSIFPWLVKDTFLDNVLAWTFVFVIPVAVFFGVRKKKNWKKIIIGSLVFGTLFGAILEFVAHLTLAWQVPNSVFQSRIFGVSSFEALIFYAPMTLLILVFYEHFFDKDINHRISPNIWYAIVPGG